MKILLIAFISLFSIKSCFNSDSFKLFVVMDDAYDLKPGDKVKCKGLKVGSVSTIQIQGNKVVAELNIDNDFHPTKGTTAQINFENFLGGKDIILYPTASSELLASSDTIYASKSDNLSILEDLLKKNIPLDSIAGNLNIDSIGIEILKDTASINKLKDAAGKLLKLKDLLN